MIGLLAGVSACQGFPEDEHLPSVGVTMTGLLAGVSAFPGSLEDKHLPSALGVFNCG